MMEGSIASENSISILGIKLPNKIIMGNSTQALTLNGYALYSAWGEQIYLGALYTEYREHNPNRLLLNDAPMAMAFYFLSDNITPQMLNQLFTEDILVNSRHSKKNPKIEKARLLELQANIIRNFHKGDALLFYCTPTHEVEMRLNHELLFRWPYAKSFFNMLLKMWIGPHPPSRDFKQAILFTKDVSAQE